MHYVLGIDAGGTYFRILALSLDRLVLGSIESTPLGYFTSDMKEYEQKFISLIQSCLLQFKGNIANCAFMVCAISGIDNEEDRSLFASFIKRCFINTPFLCFNDAELALESIIKNSGILLNSGTGSIAYGKNPKGEISRVGGWSLRIFGDEGSGAWISLQALRHLAKYFDGIVPESLFISSLKKELCIDSAKMLMDFSLHYTLDKLACIPPLIDRFADCDSFANKIIHDASKESFFLVSLLAKKLNFNNNEVLRIGLWGSNILKSEKHRKIFYDMIKEEYPKAELCFPEKELIDFACDRALREVQKEEN